MKRILLLSFMLTFVFAFSAWAQRTVSGTVTSEDDGSTVPGVNVVLKGTTTGTTTDLDGNYRLSVPEEGGTIVFSFIGLETQEVEVGARSVIDVAMSSGVQQLTEVVVTALGAERSKKALGYSVQEVSGEDMAKTDETHIINSLQGQVAGVQIQGTQSSIGGSSRITIRGANSFLGNNQPLFVVDGVPMGNTNFANNSQMRGFGTDATPYDYGNAAISDINPEDVKSLNVLKGAAATALYGVRGANGVIVIETKKGRSQKGIGVSVNSSVTFDQVNNLLPHQDTYGGGSISSTASGFVEFTEDGTSYLAPVYAKDGAWGPKFNGAQVRHWDSWDPNAANYGETRPWSAPAVTYEDFFETGVTMTNSVALEGGNDLATFRLGYTNLDQKGTIPNSEMSRNTISFNASISPTEKLYVSTSANFVRQNVNQRNVTGYNNANPMQGFTQWWQTNLDVNKLENYQMLDGTQYVWNHRGPVLDDDGSLISFDERPQFFDNPYFVRNEYRQNDVKDRLFGNINMTYDLTSWLSINAKAMRDGFTWDFYEGVPVGGIDLPEYQETTRSFQETNYQLHLNFNQTFGDISLTGTLGANRMRQRTTFTEVATQGGLALPGFFHLSNSVQPAQYTPGVNLEEWGINSAYAVASVGWKDMLFVDANIRLDWASTLPEAENPFSYPGISTSFVFSELPALNSDILTFGKVRVAYGQAANSPQPYSLFNTYAPQTPNWGSASRFVVPNARNNPNLGPEVTTEIEFGASFELWSGRVGLDVTYYDRETTDQIIPVDISPATGFTSQFVNAGIMTNNGIEVMFNATPIKVGDFAWRVDLNFATFNNEVVELAEGIQSIGRGGTWAAELRIQEGYPYMGLWGQDFVRENYQEDEEGVIIQNEGDIVVGSNGRPTPTDQRIFLGSAIPDFTGGLRNTFTWKGLSAGFMIDFQEGGVIHSTSLQWANYSGMTPESVFQGGVDIRENGLVVNGVTSEGAENTTPVDLGAQGYYQTYWSVAAPNVYEASFVKLREISVSYTLPNSLLSGTPIRDVSFGFIGRNLAILSADLPYLDPQVINGSGNDQGLENAQVPSTRSLGFNVGFKF